MTMASSIPVQQTLPGTRSNLAVMGVLRFSFGTMGSGKSTLALQIHHNLTHGGLRGALCSMLDRKGARVSSRLGVSAEAVVIDPTVDLREVARNDGKPLEYLVCDEAQFYTPEQIEQLAEVVDELRLDVFAFGLLTDFRGRLFPGTARLLELADVSEALQCEARCWCGDRATHNARVVDGVQVYEGELMVVDDPASAPDVRYELRCRKHWTEGQGRPDIIL
ncbi:MAG: thymidine kinase [Acidimicrobiia bacterium]|nr:thymidine kinase [Acidimicrobiia bacterium]